MDPLSILLFLLLFGLSAFFSGSEIAFMSLGMHQIDGLIKQKKTGARIVKNLKKNTERLLILILIGNNLVNVITASLATKISIDIANKLGSEQGLAIGISTGVITLLLLLFGEIFPKTFAASRAETIALKVAPLYNFLQYLFFPLVVVIERLMKKTQKTKKPIIISEEEIEAFIDMSKEHGGLEKREHEGIKNMLDFYDITVEEIMTPRIKIDALDANISVQKAIDEVLELSHSRIPVYQDSIDNIIGVLTLRELLELKKEGEEETLLKYIDITEAIKVPLNKPIYKVLDLFKNSRKHLAVVMDEYGGVAGIVTLEDVIEEVFGEIQDETDEEKMPIKIHKGEMIVQSGVRIEEILDKLGLDFDDINFNEDEFTGETLSYFITDYLERFPHQGEQIILPIKKEGFDKKKIIIRILHTEDNVIGEVKIFLK